MASQALTFVFNTKRRILSSLWQESFSLKAHAIPVFCFHSHTTRKKILRLLRKEELPFTICYENSGSTRLPSC